MGSDSIRFKTFMNLGRPITKLELHKKEPKKLELQKEEPVSFAS